MLLRTVLLIAACSAPAASYAQVVANGCATHGAIVNHLGRGWGEARVGVMLDADQNVVEVFVNAQTGTWTFTLTRPGGPTCMVASGDSFEFVDEMPDKSIPG